MPKHGSPDAQKAWENLYKLIMLCPDPEGWGFREKLEEASLAYGKIMNDWGHTVGWNSGFDAGSGFED